MIDIVKNVCKKRQLTQSHTQRPSLKNVIWSATVKQNVVNRN